MADGHNKGFRLSVAAAGLGALALLGWFALSDSTAPTESPAAEAAPEPERVDPVVAARKALEAADRESGRLRLVEHGRLSLSQAQLPETGNLLLALDLPVDARGAGERVVRIVSVDGRRLDTTAQPIAGDASGLELAIDPGFLRSGRYMIEVETDADHPLQLRRYVLELE